MKLPNGEQVAEIPSAKLEGYCLNPEHPVGKHKARVFAALGIDSDDAGDLRAALLRQARESDEWTLGELDSYGQRYEIRFAFGRANIVSGWMIDTGQVIPRLITAFPL